MTRIAVGGFLHETNTFAPTKATYDDFVHGGGWPPMTQAPTLLEIMRNINVGMAGFVRGGRGRRLGVGADHLRAAPAHRRMSRRMPIERIAKVIDRRHRSRRRARRASISICTARWSPNISTTAKAKSSPACAR